MRTDSLALAPRIADKFKAINCLDAVGLGGSQSGAILDKHSDIYLYMYADEVVPFEMRKTIVTELGPRKADLNLTFWDVGDEWYDLATGTEIDIIYWDKTWIKDQIDRSIVDHQANMGYSTCFWDTVLNSKVMFDRDGWLTTLQKKCNQPFPEPLRQAIIAKNYPVLRKVIPSYYGQIRKAVDWNDLISINHRLAALFASYFDILFALNRVLNPGEKKIMRFVQDNCSIVPQGLEGMIDSILVSAARGDERTLKHLDDVLDALDKLLILGKIEI